MSYDFDSSIDRRGSGCFKYDALNELYGRDDLISLWVADMDFAVAPAIREALQKRLDHGVFGYNLQLAEYYEVAAAWIGRRYAYPVQRDWMINTPGVMPAVNLAVMQLTQPGDGVLIQTPVYRPFFNAVLDHGRTLLASPLQLREGQYFIDFEDFEDKLKRARLFILCSPHNPIGRVWDEEELRMIGTLCRKYKVPIISDEIHADLAYDGRKAVSIASLEDFADNCICCYSPAKSFNLAGLTTSIIVVKNPELRQPLKAIVDKLHLYLGNSFGIRAIIAAYRDSDDWLAALLAYLQANRDYLVDYIGRELPQVQLSRPQSTYLAWIDFRGLGHDDAGIRSLLVNQARLALDPGLKFGEDGSGWQRLNFGCPRAILAEAMQRLKQAVEGI